VASLQEHELPTIPLPRHDVPVTEKPNNVLSCVAREILQPCAQVIAILRRLRTGRIDSLSIIRLEEHLGR